jgi:hypothetical protein
VGLLRAKDPFNQKPIEEAAWIDHANFSEQSLERKMAKNWIFPTLAAAAVAVGIVACGGGGGGGEQKQSVFSISGTAATGAPIPNAKVYIVDSLGRTPVGQDEANSTALVTTDANGQYTIPSSILIGLTPPYMVRVVGQMLTESGDMGPAVFHSIILSNADATVNITPLTEAHTALTLGAQPALAYGSTSALQSVSSSSLAAANTKLVTALTNVADFSANPNFVSDPLDATPGAPGASNARKHDATLDQLSVTVSDGKIVLADRNQDDSSFATGPRVEVSVDAKTVATPSGPISAKATPIDLGRVKEFAQRFTTKLAVQCDLEAEPAAGATGLCDAVTNPANNIFHASFKDKGMSSWRWLRGWLSDAFETTNLTDVSVTVVSTNLGSFLADDPAQTRVYRVLLKFSKGTDTVMRQMLLTDDGNMVKAYGNQKNFFFYIAPRFNYRVDASGIYPYYPQYEQGVSIMLKHWFGGQNDVVFGAKVTGPGLPATRQSGTSAANGFTAGVDVNRNGLSSGIEVFDRRPFGCSAYAIDPSVYMERNTAPWTGTVGANGVHRWRPDSTTCNPLFDVLRYDVQRDQSTTGFTVPKRGDVYQVTLYLDANKFAPTTGVAPPAGAQSAQTIKNSDGVSKSVLPYTFSFTLGADAFALPDANFNPSTFGFPGLTQTTRENLQKMDVGGDLAISWTKNKTTLADGSTFGSFYAGRYMSSYDQWGTYQSTASPAFVYDDGSTSANYGELTTYNHGTGTTGAAVYTAANCGKATTQKYRNGLVYTIPLIRKGNNSSNYNYSATTCSNKENDLASALTQDASAAIVYSNQRARKQYVSDRGRLVATSDTSQILKFSDLISRESANSLNFCSAYNGFVRTRQAYVQLSDVNGRQIMEMREVWWDFPNKIPYTNAAVSDRPRQDTDTLYLANTSVGKAGYAGERGYVHPAQLVSGGQCVPKVW